MARLRKEVTPFNLSFLDVMFCGFGAVVLLVMLLNGKAVSKREEIHADLRGEVIKLEIEVQQGRKNLVQIRNSLDKAETENVTTEGKTIQARQHIDKTQQELANLNAETLASIAHINKLKTDLKTLDKDTKRLGANAKTPNDGGSKAHKTTGDGNRQYLTGLNLGGKRTLILVDKSASMLARTIVNIIRLRNLPHKQQRQAPKWRRTTASVEWLVANLPGDSKYQIIAFSSEANELLPETRGNWLDVKDSPTLERALVALKGITPKQGTNLLKAFRSIQRLKPAPDNIILLTDGLPTQGFVSPTKSTISATDRLKLFQQAAKVIKKGTPVNTILFPLEGDPYAAGAFWKLAVDSKGSFMTPSSDWP